MRAEALASFLPRAVGAATTYSYVQSVPATISGCSRVSAAHKRNLPAIQPASHSAMLAHADRAASFSRRRTGDPLFE